VLALASYYLFAYWPYIRDTVKWLLATEPLHGGQRDEREGLISLEELKDQEDPPPGNRTSPSVKFECCDDQCARHLSLWSFVLRILIPFTVFFVVCLVVAFIFKLATGELSKTGMCTWVYLTPLAPQDIRISSGSGDRT